MPIGVDRAFTAGEERKRLAGKRVERPLLDLDKVRPDRFLIAMPRMAQRHSKHPGPSPLTRGGVERGRPAEEIHLRLGPRRTVKDAAGSSRRRQRPHKPFHRFVARAVGNIEGIALEVGYRSRKNFYRMFKTLTGLTPTAFRNIADNERRDVMAKAWKEVQWGRATKAYPRR